MKKCLELIRRFNSYEKEKRKRLSKKNQLGNKRKRQGKSVERKQVASPRIPRMENNDVLGQTESGEISCDPFFIAKFDLA
ncbi:hypothetical protein KIN20_035089 [Parelaphostrongylus tenuis]|uniref:Uncharacterized protein n=1 Tax=Parelaphostrongylus tenuis TaxID=148309 RepID=A0AAD5WK74_PARTN|nr:hypothetical protein KIN20_035089 [Parelaphostrongylus tenuis]